MKVRSPSPRANPRDPARDVSPHRGTRYASEPIFDLSKPALFRSGAHAGLPLDGPTRSLLSRSTDVDLTSVRVHTHPAIARAVDSMGARAITVGRDVYFGPGEYAPDRSVGRELLAHEVGHVLQQTRPGLPIGSSHAAERDADAFAARVMAGRHAWVSIGAPIAPAFRPKKRRRVADPGPQFRRGDHVIGMRIIKVTDDDGTVVVSTRLGDTFPYKLDHCSIQPGTYTAPPRGGGDIDVTGVSGRVVLNYSGEPDPATLVFAKQFTLVVQQAGAGGGSAGGTGPIDAPTATSSKQPMPPSSKADTGITITVDDPAQLKQLRDLGVKVDNDTPSNKPKVTLTFEEAKRLLEALNKVRSPGGTKYAADAPTWLDWAKFVEANKDKLSGGPAGTSDRGLTLDEVKQTLVKYRRFVGVQKGAEYVDLKERIKDPALAESWNSLQDWERKMWEDYAKEFPDVKADEGRTDLHITAADKQRIAIKLSWKYFPAGFKDAARALFSDPLFYVTTFASVMMYVALWLNPEPIFSKATAAALTIALLAVFSMSEILNFARAWSAVGDESENATTMAELEVAGEHFGKRMGGAGFRVLFMIFTYLLGKTLPMPKGGSGVGGGGGFQPEAVPAGGPGGGTGMTIAAEGATIQVLADGTVVIMPAVGSQVLMSSKATGKARSGGGAAGGGKGRQTKSTEQEPEAEPVKIVKGSPESVKAWKTTLKTRPASQPNEPQGRYQIDECGPTEYEITGGGEKVFADGVDDATASAREAKFVKNPSRSPWIDDSDIPQKIRKEINADVRDEFRRYGAVINSADCPLTWLRVIVSDARAIPFFERLLAAFGIPGEVVKEP